jgi:hypothetical protein
MNGGGSINKQLAIHDILDADFVDVQILLIYTTESSSIYGHVIRCIFVEEAQLRFSDMVAHLENWSLLEAQRIYKPFVGMVSVPVFIAMV